MLFFEGIEDGATSEVLRRCFWILGAGNGTKQSYTFANKLDRGSYNDSHCVRLGS
jgi:hypothetical protein